MRPVFHKFLKFLRRNFKDRSVWVEQADFEKIEKQTDKQTKTKDTASGAVNANHSTGGPHKLCDRLYFEFIEAMYGNIENPRLIVLDCDRYSHLTSK